MAKYHSLSTKSQTEHKSPILFIHKISSFHKKSLNLDQHFDIMKKNWFKRVDVSEDDIKEYDESILEILLADRTTGNNILWGTDDYVKSKGADFAHDKQIRIDQITGENNGVIMPRVLKTKEAQKARSKTKAEVFTPAWICNAQNNLVDEAWFGYKNSFNKPNSSKKSPHEYTIAPLKKRDPEQKVKFPEGKKWQDYVKLNRMEIACGEAPYLVNRYDSDSENVALRSSLKLRIGLLDRKMRVICENASYKKEWLEQTKLAYQHIYGFEWQGDNLLLARENLLLTLFDYYQFYFGDSKMPDKNFVREIAEIISWNLWQMDGLTLQLINTPKQKYEPNALYEDTNKDFCKIMDWDKGEIIYFAELVKDKH